MEIKIRKIGFNVGTCGWLVDGLNSGNITIAEGKTKTGKHGLWLNIAHLFVYDCGKTKTGKHGLWLSHKANVHPQQVLALFDGFNIADQYEENRKYQITDEFNTGFDRSWIWTNAAWESLMGIAQNWCDQANDDRLNDDPVEIKITRLETEVVA